MKKISFMGECMIELRSVESNLFSQSFAGDVYNSAVYLKRCFPEITTSVITATGIDNLSNRMITRFEDELLDTRWVHRVQNKHPGMYLIETDEQGERSFTYWRSDSAARDLVLHLEDNTIDELAQEDMFFFSGITLAVIRPEHLTRFWEVLSKLQTAGVKIVFDPNFRANLWACNATAKTAFERALKLSTIALPGIEDLSALYDIQNADDVITLYKSFGVQEIVVKNGSASVVTCLGDDVQEHPISPVSNVVDTTSAGDAFNGVYLGARLAGLSVAVAVQKAAKAASVVIQHPGAIAPEADFRLAMKT